MSKLSLCRINIWLFYVKRAFFFFLFRAALAEYGSSQARGWSGAKRSYGCWPIPQPQQCRIWATSVIYTTAQGNTRSLTCWVRPGIKPASSWIRVGFVSAGPRWELLREQIFWTLGFLFMIKYCKRFFFFYLLSNLLRKNKDLVSCQINYSCFMLSLSGFCYLSKPTPLDIKGTKFSSALCKLL